MDERATTGAAVRRHEQVAIKMALATAPRQSSDRVARAQSFDAKKMLNSREESVYFEMLDKDTEVVRPDVLAHRGADDHTHNRSCSSSYCSCGGRFSAASFFCGS